jgi:cytidine deaminase
MIRGTCSESRLSLMRRVGFGLLSFILLAVALATDGGRATGEETAMAKGDDRLARAIALARQARGRAYAPYSRFKMGAVVVTDRGVLVPGTLIENVSLGLAMCAERVALFSSIAQAAGRPEMLVLVSPRTDGKLTFPCGACLQVARELGGADMHVEACDLDGACEGTTLGNLAPHLPHKARVTGPPKKAP